MRSNGTGNWRVQKFTPGGQYLLHWGRFGTTEGRFYDANGIAIDESGAIFVSDTYNQRVQKFAYPVSVEAASWGRIKGRYRSPLSEADATRHRR